MKERTKETLKDGFGSLINNAAALRGAKNGPLWLTILMFVFSLFLPIVPLFASYMNTNGDSFLKTYSYGLERYVTRTAIDLKNNGYEFALGEDRFMSVTKDGATITYGNYISFNPEKENEVTGATPLTGDVNQVTNEYNLLVFVSDLNADSKKASNYNKYISSQSYKAGTTTLKDALNDPEGQQYYTPSYIVVFKNSIYVAITDGSKAKAGSPGGNFQLMKANNECLKALLEVKDKEDNAVVQSLIDDNYVGGVYKNFKSFLNKTYNSIKAKNAFGTSGIYLAIYFGVSILMGFLMWVLTRGKKNPNNYFSPWLTMKIEARLALAPALITLIVGFFLTQYASLIFIMTLGLRVMWISMKELRPIQQ